MAVGALGGQGGGGGLGSGGGGGIGGYKPLYIPCYNAMLVIVYL